MVRPLPIKHIGVFSALCDGRKKAHLREDLGVERYRQLGVKERFTNEEPYRICPKCIYIVGDALRVLKVKELRFARRARRNSTDRQTSHD